MFEGSCCDDEIIPLGSCCDEETIPPGTLLSCVYVTDPDTICPPLATTALPVVFSANVIVMLLSSVVTIDSGIIRLSVESKTDTITSLDPKLWVITLDVVFEKVSGLEAISAIVVVTFVRAEPSPLKYDAVTALVTFKLFSVASEPLTISFFQFGIIFLLRLATGLPVHFPQGPIIYQ